MLFWKSQLFARPGSSVQLLIASLFIAVLGLASSLFVIQVYGRYLAHGIDGTLYTLAGGMLIVIAAEFLLRRLRHRMAVSLQAPAEKALSERVFNHLLYARPAHLAMIESDQRRAAVRQLDSVFQAFSPTNLLALIDVPFALLFIAAVFLISPLLGAITLVLTALAAFTGIWGAFRSQGSSLQQMQSTSEQQNTLSSADDPDNLRISNAQSYLAEQWQAKSGATRWWRHRLGNQQDRLQSSNQSWTLLCTVLVVSAGAMEVIAGNMDFGLLIGANILASRALMLVARPAQSLAQLQQGKASLQMIDKFLSLPLEADRGTKMGDFSGRLEIKDLSFAYPGSPSVLYEKVQLELPPGSILRVIGGNGAGKTTLCRLLSGLQQPTRGAILADGIDLRQLNPHHWRQQLIYMPQEPRFINASLRDNLLTLNPDLDDEALIEILNKVGLKGFVDQSPEGLDLQIIEGGTLMALGIRRRLALARALTTEGRLVIIDEPAEGLDQAGTEMIGRVLSELVHNKHTLIVLSHDPNLLNGQGMTLDLNQKPVPVLHQPVRTPTVSIKQPAARTETTEAGA